MKSSFILICLAICQTVSTKRSSVKAGVYFNCDNYDNEYCKNTHNLNDELYYKCFTRCKSFTITFISNEDIKEDVTEDVTKDVTKDVTEDVKENAKEDINDDKMKCSDIADDMYYTVIALAAGKHVLKAKANVKGEYLKLSGPELKEKIVGGDPGTPMTARIGVIAYFPISVFGLGKLLKKESPKEKLQFIAIEQSDSYRTNTVMNIFPEGNTLNYSEAVKEIENLGTTGRQYTATITIFVD